MGDIKEDDYRKIGKRSAVEKPRQIVTVGPLRVNKSMKEENAVTSSSIASWCFAALALVALAGVVAKRKLQANRVEEKTEEAEETPQQETP